MLLLFGYLVSAITNMIAASFCWLLAAQLEGNMKGKAA
jgi:uncharacterized protein involved in cysteine biosynthesis